MKIGLISDTHNELEMTKKAVDVFKNNKVDLVIHAGDFTSPEILELFKEFECRFVIGNADSNLEILNKECESLGFNCLENRCDLEYANKRILVIHGNIVPIFREAVASGKYDYVIKGHAHFFENYVRNNTRVINPGSLYDSDELTVAILDTELDEVKKIEIE